jgi:hypothetical protein
MLAITAKRTYLSFFNIEKLVSNRLETLVEVLLWSWSWSTIHRGWLWSTHTTAHNVVRIVHSHLILEDTSSSSLDAAANNDDNNHKNNTTSNETNNESNISLSYAFSSESFDFQIVSRLALCA